MRTFRSATSAYIIFGGVFAGMFMFCVYAAIDTHADFWRLAAVTGTAFLIAVLWLALFQIDITEDELVFRSLFGGRRRIKHDDIRKIRLGVALSGSGPLRLVVQPKDQDTQAFSINAKVFSSAAIRAVLDLGERVATADSSGLEDGIITRTVRRRRTKKNERDAQ
jgi:hypothetical protein